MKEKTDLILLPGLLCDSDLWTHQVTYLEDVSVCRVAAATEADTMEGMAESVLSVSPERFALAGLSMGGYVAQAIMRIAPERVTRLALLDTSARPDTPEQTKRRKQLLEMSSAGEFRRVTDLLLPILLHKSRMSDDILTGRIKAMAEHVGSEAFALQQKAIMHRPDNRPNLGAIAVPTLVLCGRQDALTPPGIHEEMAGLIPNSRYALIEECGHMTTMERPFATTALLREWLVND